MSNITISVKSCDTDLLEGALKLASTRNRINHDMAMLFLAEGEIELFKKYNAKAIDYTAQVLTIENELTRRLEVSLYEAA